MECNKDEAKRAMDIAERKITEKDYNGAKKFAYKAQNLFPNLDGLKQLLMTVEVYISGERKIPGEADWYGILGVNPLATDVEVRKQYLRLALMLHPDKNKFKGAEGAFNLLSEAWGLMSDRDKRNLYNEKIWRIYGTQPNVPTTQSAANPPPPHQPTPSYRYEPVTVVESRPKPKPKPRGRKGKSSVDKINATTQPTVPRTQSANPPHKPTPSYRSEPVTVESRPKPRGDNGKSSVEEEKEWFVKRRLVKRSDRRVRTTP